MILSFYLSSLRQVVTPDLFRPGFGGKMKKVTLKDYADKYNTKLTRRGNRMTESYLYRLIRQHEGREKSKPTANPPKGLRPLWFNYELEGPKERIWIILPK